MFTELGLGLDGWKSDEGPEHSGRSCSSTRQNSFFVSVQAVCCCSFTDSAQLDFKTSHKGQSSFCMRRLEYLLLPLWADIWSQGKSPLRR